MKQFGLITTLVIYHFIGFGQTRCGADEFNQAINKTDKRFSTQRQETMEYLEAMQIKNYKTVNTGSGVEYHVPVVVHVIHTGGGVGSNYNPTDAAIEGFINRINDGFANTIDESTIPGTFNSINIPIRFYLAQRNELAACSPTNGIVRINQGSNAIYASDGVGSPGITDASLKALSHWNDLDYYNIYIVNKIDGVDGFCTGCTFTAGYALFPVLGGHPQDGMVVLAQQVNSTSNTFIHEMGHSFDLYHPFEGGSSSSCPPVTASGCTVDNDRVCDTDPVRLNFTCNPSGSNPCGGNWSASTTQFNYMAYFGCNDRFTPGQATRVNNALNLVRTGYKNSAGLDAPPSSLPTMITPPTFNSTNLNNGFDMGPKYVQLNGIEYTSQGYTFEGAGSVFYADHTCNQSTTLVKGLTYPITIKTAINIQKVRVYIDYNGDGTFGTTAPELVFSSNATSPNFTHTGNITIPLSSPTIIFNTPLRMRVIADNASTISPTMQLNAGQAEDYSIMVLSEPLAVVWKNFSVALNMDNYATIRWSTSSEINNEYFEIEKSNDAIKFQPIAKIISTGNSNASSAYSHVDKQVSNGRTYYRIKQVDLDGQFTYSEVQSIFREEKGFVAQIFPIPIEDYFKLKIENPKKSHVEITIFDMNGQIISSDKRLLEEGETQLELSANQLKSGIYLLRLKHAFGVTTIRIIK